MNRVKFNYRLTKKSPKKSAPIKSTQKKKQSSEEDEDEYYKYDQDLDLNDDEDYTINEYYLYNDISMKSIQGLLKFIKNAEKRWKLFLLETSDIMENATPKPLKIFINSNGGDVFAAIPLIDAITNCPVPIHTFVEGMAASAASLLSMMGHKRFITKNSFMLIHELRTGVQGTYSDIMDEKENCDKLMDVIKKIYLEKTKGNLESDTLEKILKRDIILTSEECKTYGLVDEII
jgi:ATP-dependent Clp endopeptidase proteolytic subunit ClpP